MKKAIKFTEVFKDHWNKWREVTLLYIGSILSKYKDIGQFQSKPQ